MAAPDLDVLQTDVLKAGSRLHDVERIYGKQSEEYQSALCRFARIWAVMRMRRKPDEFVPEKLFTLS